MHTHLRHVTQELKYFDSVINYFPANIDDLKNGHLKKHDQLITHLKSKIGILANIGLFQSIYKKRIGYQETKAVTEQDVPGRMYSYVGIKNNL